MANFAELMDFLAARTCVRSARLLTHVRSEVASADLQVIADRFQEIRMKLVTAFASDVHVRGFVYSDGKVISADRGLDIYKSDTIVARSCEAVGPE